MTKLQYYLLTKSIGFALNLYSCITPKRAMKMAYALFSKPRKGRINPQSLPKTLAKAQTIRYEFQGETIATYHWEGNEEVILLAHGWESNAARWKKLLPFLIRTGKTIVALDAPAHGQTTGNEFNAPKYAEYLNFIIEKFQPKIIIGHSIGGAAAVLSLHRFPQICTEKLVLLGAPSDFKIISDNFIQLLGLNQKIKRLLEHFYVTKFGIQIDSLKTHELGKNLMIKALIVHDIEDQVVKVEEGRKYASTWEQATYYETKGLGHGLHQEELYQKISTFIA